MKKLFITLVSLICGVSYLSADNVNFKWISDVNYEQVRHFSDSYSAFREGGKWGYINGKAVVVVQPQFDECKDFCNGYAAVKLNGLWGYVNRAGAVAVTPQFQAAQDFNQYGLAIVKKNDKYGVIRTDGYCPAGVIFDHIGNYSDGFALATAAGVQYYINSEGLLKHIDSKFYVGDFSDGFAPVQNRRTGKWGYLDNKGNLAIEMKYDTVYSFSNNIALVKYQDKYQHIRKSGAVKTIESAAGQSLKFVNGFAKIRTALGVGFINKDFKFLPIMGKNASDFNKNRIAALELENKQLCYIDHTGKIIFKVDYDRIGNFSSGLAWVCKNDKYGYIDTKGNLVIDTVFTSATDFKDSLAYVSTKDRFGCIRYMPGYVMPKPIIRNVELRDNNADGKVEAEETFDIAVTLANQSFEDMTDVRLNFANQIDQVMWFRYKTPSEARIPVLKAHSDTTVVINAKSDISILSSDVSMRFVSTAGNLLNHEEYVWTFETVGIKACKPVVTRYWFYRDDHSSISPGKVNLLMTIKNDGKDPARDVRVKINLPDGVTSSSPVMNIPTLMPGEVKDISTVFFIDETVTDEQSLVARISDKSQQHNSIEYLSYTVGKPGVEVRLDGSPVFNVSQGPSSGTMAAAKIAASQDTGIGKDAFVSELLVDMHKIATPDDNKYAIIFGNEDYNVYNRSSVKQPDVDYAEADAEAFRQYCINYMGVKEDHIRFLLNGTGSQIKREFSYIQNWAKAKGGGIELYVFYAGHAQPDDEGKATYLIPVDVPLTEPAAGIKLDEFYGIISSIGARKKIVFLDACYSGQGRAGGRLVLKQPLISGNMLVFTAASSIEKSMPYKEKRHGMFTYFLLNTIKQANGQLTLEELFSITKDQVMHRSVNVNQSMQTPELIRGYGIDNDWKKWRLY